LFQRALQLNSNESKGKIVSIKAVLGRPTTKKKRAILLGHWTTKNAAILLGRL
jgi:hypothetical protein